jgi:uncharacterized membrane protein (DUF373 family)
MGSWGCCWGARNVTIKLHKINRALFMKLKALAIVLVVLLGGMAIYYNQATSTPKVEANK